MDRELTAFSEELFGGMGRIERRHAMMLYVMGLLLDGERKSTQPMAARLVADPAEAEAMRQRLQECVSISTWADEEVRRRLAVKLDGELPGVEAFVVDDTGFPKKGQHSVGVARQYSGTLGRVDNCQVATSLHLASERGSGCIALRLYLPDAWARDEARRRKAGVPEDVSFLRKWEIALSQLDDALRWGVRPHPVLADAGYGDVFEFREQLDARGLPYVLSIASSQTFWLPGRGPEGDEASAEDRPFSAAEIGNFLGRRVFQRVRWRDGSRGEQASNFARLRVRCARGHSRGDEPGKEEWLLCEWPDGESAPTKFWLSTLSGSTPVRELARLAKLRWRVERDYQEMKQEVGLDHFEGRTWRGFHHHATLCAVAHGFLALRRALFPPAENPMDAADGQTAASAGAATSPRLLSSLSSARRGARTTQRAIAHLIT